MPAAAVIPAPIAYIKVVAVKKLVVEFLPRTTYTPSGVVSVDRGILPAAAALNRVFRTGTFTLRKLECFKQAYALNILAWNNNLGLRFYFVGF